MLKVFAYLQYQFKVSMLTWVLIDVFRGKQVGLINLCAGCIAGLASITPDAGFGTNFDQLQILSL